MLSTFRIGSTRLVRAGFCLVIVGVLAGPAARSASAALFTLTDGNSVSQFDTATQANNFNWFVDGTDYLEQQAFWYRVGNVAEQSVHTLPIATQGVTDGNFDGNPDTLFVRYTGNGFRVDTRYTLQGGTPGSGASDLGEQITIVNTGTSPLDFHFFQYADFDLSANDTVVFTNANSVQQFAGGSKLTETVVTPVPSHHEAALFPLTLNKLNDALATTLSDTPAIGVPLVGGDVTWAYQWDVVIAPGDSFQISKDKRIDVSVPEPASASMLALGAALLLGRRRRAICSLIQ